jgi:hypothetical protein
LWLSLLVGGHHHTGFTPVLFGHIIAISRETPSICLTRVIGWRFGLGPSWYGNNPAKVLGFDPR